MSSIPVPYNKSVLVLSCVSIVGQGRAIDKVYSISRFSNVLWNCYFLSKLLSQSLYFLSPYLYSFVRATFSKDVVFQNGWFWKGNLVDYLDLKVPGAFTEWTINFSTKFQYWISWNTNSLRLVIPDCNISF